MLLSKTHRLCYHSVNVITFGLPKVISLSGFYCTLIFQDLIYIIGSHPSLALAMDEGGLVEMINVKANLRSAPVCIG